MNIILFLSAAAVSADPELIVTAARETIDADLTGSAVMVIDAPIRTLALPQLVDVLRLSPGVSISRTGPTGSQTQVRIRGAESNHTLVFIDGIEANDPASSGDFRWETLGSDGIERVEVLRGPQSALWGSEAIGGVVAVTSRKPISGTKVFGSAEAGSFDTRRAAAGFNLGSEKAGIVVQSSGFDTSGIDAIADGPAERDGFETFAASVKASIRPSDAGEFGIVARHSSSLSAFDGFDSTTFQRADTDDATRIRSTALRGHARLATFGGGWRHEVFGTYLATDNINRNAGDFLNRSEARTFRTGYQTGVDLRTGIALHRLTAAAEYRIQRFRADDEGFLGGTRQRVSRERSSAVIDYGLNAGPLSLGVSLRHDDNDSFADTTTWRTTGRLALNGEWSLRASAGEGVADPTFTEQFGFFPGSFVGNPDLKPERSFGWDAAIVYAHTGFSADIGWFQTDLEDEIVSVFDPSTFLSGVANANGRSKRRGIEASFDSQPARWLHVGGNYTWLDADEAPVAGSARIREVRRARHSGTLTASFDIDAANVSFTASYVGKRRDIDFDAFPARDVSLGDYVLASLGGRLPISDRLELTGRIENLFDSRYEDVFGYQTQGISAFGGIRVLWGG